MSLLERIGTDLKESLKAGDAERSGLLRMLASQLHNREIEKRGAGEDSSLTDDEAMGVLRKEAKKRKESMEAFEKGGRADLKEKEEAELKIIETYLPAAPTEEDIRRVVGEIKNSGTTAFPEIMKEAMKRLPGADGKEVAKAAKGE